MRTTGGGQTPVLPRAPGPLPPHLHQPVTNAMTPTLNDSQVQSGWEASGFKAALKFLN